MLTTVCRVFYIKALRLLKQAQDDKTAALLSWADGFVTFYNSEFLNSERLKELDEEEPQLYHNISNVSKRVGEIKDLLVSFLEAARKNDLGRLNSLAGMINQQASNVNEDIDSFTNSQDFEDIFEYKGRDISELIQNFLINVANVIIRTTKGLDLPEEEYHPEPNESDGEEEGDSEERNLTYQIRKDYEEVAIQHNDIEQNKVIAIANTMIRRSEYFKEYLKKWRSNPDVKKRELERAKEIYQEKKSDPTFKERDRLNKKLQRDEMRKAHQLISVVKKDYETILELKKDPLALSRLREDDYEKYNKLMNNYVKYKSKIESDEVKDDDIKLNDQYKKILEKSKQRVNTLNSKKRQARTDEMIKKMFPGLID